MNEALGLSVELDPYAIGAFVAYLLLLVSVGIYSSRFSSRGISEYFIGGRKMNRFVVALSGVNICRNHVNGRLTAISGGIQCCEGCV
jgi:hypothetical protein